MRSTMTHVNRALAVARMKRDQHRSDCAGRLEHLPVRTAGLPAEAGDGTQRNAMSRLVGEAHDGRRKGLALFIRIIGRRSVSAFGSRTSL